jgi:hypothetical protein
MGRVSALWMRKMNLVVTWYGAMGLDEDWPLCAWSARLFVLAPHRGYSGTSSRQLVALKKYRL